MKTITVDSTSIIPQNNKQKTKSQINVIPTGLPQDIWIPQGGTHILGRLNDNWISRSIGKGDFVDILRRSSKTAKRFKYHLSQESTKETQGQPSESIPDRLLSIAKMKPTKWRDTVKGRMPCSWKASSQDCILVDLDKADGIDGMDMESFVGSIKAVVDSKADLDGRVAIVRTSENGLQVWLGLTGHADPRMLSTHSEWQISIYSEIRCSAISSGLISAKIDKTAVGCGRYGRRAAPRIKKGRLYVSDLIYSAKDIQNTGDEEWH